MQIFPLKKEERKVQSLGAFEEGFEQLALLADPAHDYFKLNWKRYKRLRKSYKPSEEMIELISKLPEQHWVMIGADWCGDVAQNLPMIANWLDDAPQIQFSFLDRDENLDLMDHFLTRGSRSIPKLIAINEAHEVLFQWGPRPDQLQELFYDLRDKGIDSKEIMHRVHKAYIDSKGKAIELDFLELLNKEEVF
jgi:hypothetical protein